VVYRCVPQTYLDIGRPFRAHRLLTSTQG